jgi:hypothetical protein
MKTTLARTIITIILLGVLCGIGSAATDQWSGTGPFTTGQGDRVITALALVPNGSIVYCGTGSGTVFSYTPYQEGDFTLTLHPGWNFVATPRKLATGNDTAQLFGNVHTSGRSIWRYDALVKQWKPMTATTKVSPLDGIWIYSDSQVSIPLWFSHDPLGTPPEKPVYAGWNAIGFSDTIPLSAKSTLSSVNADWSSAIGYDAATQGYESSIINGGSGDHSENREMLPGKGYWLFMVKNGTLAGISA